MKKEYIQPEIQVVVLSEATSVMYDTSVPQGGDITDDNNLPVDAKKHNWGLDFETWDSYSNDQVEENVW